MRSFPVLVATLLASGAAPTHALDFEGGENPGFEREMLAQFARLTYCAAVQV